MQRMVRGSSKRTNLIHITNTHRAARANQNLPRRSLDSRACKHDADIKTRMKCSLTIYASASPQCKAYDDDPSSEPKTNNSSNVQAHEADVKLSLH